MLPFKKIYFDSNILIAGGRPVISTGLRNVLSLARAMKVQVFLLEPVERELEAHWMRDFAKTETELLNKTNNMSRILSGVGSKPELQIPKPDDIRARYQETVKKLIEAGLEKAPDCRRSLDELFEMAIWQKKPFKEKGVGFQDAVICLAAIDHLAQSPDKTGAFVSRDGVFDQETIADLGHAAKVNLILYEGLEPLSKVLVDELAAAAKRRWEKDQQRAADAVRGKIQPIQEFIKMNLEIPDRELFTEILQVHKIEVVEVSDAHTPFPWDRVDTQPIIFSADIKVAIHVLMKESPLIWPETRMLKVGGEAPASSNPLLAVMKSKEPKERVLERTAELVLRAQNENYADIEPLSVKLK